jgi:putative endonuclease
VYFVYILECEGGSLYTGITTDMARRLAEHKSGTGAHYTRAHAPRKVVYSEKHPNRSSASRREAEIKSWSRAAKLMFIKSAVTSKTKLFKRNKFAEM